jgi:hypothetical protein
MVTVGAAGADSPALKSGVDGETAVRVLDELLGLTYLACSFDGKVRLLAFQSGTDGETRLVGATRAPTVLREGDRFTVTSDDGSLVIEDGALSGVADGRLITGACSDVTPSMQFMIGDLAG